MIVKALFFLVLAVLSFAHPQNDLDVNAIDNRIEFITNFHHQPASNVKEGDILTITLEPPLQSNLAVVSELVKSFTIAIGTGSELSVDAQFFMESEHMPIPTGPMTYQFQLPAQMENKEYCIVYTPYSTENGNEKPMYNGQIMESLYEVWFPIQGSLAVGAGPKTATNTIANDVSVSTQGNVNQAPMDNTNAQVQNGADTAQTQTDAQANAQTNEESSSITISPAITAFIAVLFACFFI